MNQIIPHQIPELTVDLSAHTVGFDNAVARNVNVQLHVSVRPKSEVQEKARIHVDKITTKMDLHLRGDESLITLRAGFDLRSLLTGGQIEAIEEALQAQQGD